MSFPNQRPLANRIIVIVRYIADKHLSESRCSVSCVFHVFVYSTLDTNKQQTRRVLAWRLAHHARFHLKSDINPTNRLPHFNKKVTLCYVRDMLYKQTTDVPETLIDSLKQVAVAYLGGIRRCPSASHT